MEQIPENVTFQEMLTGMFNTDWMSPNELMTICAAAEMYADGRAKHFAKWLNVENIPDEINVELLFKKYKEQTNP